MPKGRTNRGLTSSPVLMTRWCPFPPARCRMLSAAAALLGIKASCRFEANETLIEQGGMGGASRGYGPRAFEKLHKRGTPDSGNQTAVSGNGMVGWMGDGVASCYRALPWSGPWSRWSWSLLGRCWVGAGGGGTRFMCRFSRVTQQMARPPCSGRILEYWYGIRPWGLGGLLEAASVGIPVGVVSVREGARARRMQHDLVAARPGKGEGWETRFLWRRDDLLSFVPSAAN